MCIDIVVMRWLILYRTVCCGLLVSVALGGVRVCARG